jgi:D-alanyl-D-alanine carboxypeptidase
MLDRGFANDTLSWLRPSLGTVDGLAPIDASPPNLRDEMCSGKRHKPASDEDDDTIASNNGPGGSTQALSFFPTAQPALKPSEMLAAAPAPSEPIPVYTGPTRTGAALIAAVAADAAHDQAAGKHRGKKARIAAKRPPEAAADDTGKEARSGMAKPAKHASTRQDTAAKTADKPKPKAVAKPAAKPKPDPKSTTGDAGAPDQKQHS